MMVRRRVPWTLEEAKRRRDFYDLHDAKLLGAQLQFAHTLRRRVYADEGKPMPLDREIIQ